MKSKELKILIRSMVRECVHELLAEKYIEKSMNEMAGTNHQPVIQEKKKQVKIKQPSFNRHEVAERYGLEESSPMVNLFEDTMRTNPVLNGEKEDAPGEISEKVLEKSGIMAKDWSKYF